MANAAVRSRAPKLVMRIVSIVGLLGLHVVAGVTDTLGEGVPLGDARWVVRDVAIFAFMGMLAASFTPTDPLPAMQPAGRRAVVVATVLLISSTVVFLVSPDSYTWLMEEDGVVEYATAALLLVTTGLLATAAARAFDGARRPFGAVLAFGSITAFFMAMEEISYGQRLFGIESQGIFLTANGQAETNLHNFATNQLEALVYVGVVVVLTLWPLLSDRGWPSVGRFTGLLDDLRPSLATVLVAATTAGLIYDQWRVIIVTGAFVMTAVALLRGARRTTDATDRLLMRVVAATVVTGQTITVVLGDRYLREWDVTEMREFLISLALLWWARGLRQRAGRSAELSTSASSST